MAFSRIQLSKAGQDESVVLLTFSEADAITAYGPLNTVSEDPLLGLVNRLKEKFIDDIPDLKRPADGSCENDVVLRDADMAENRRGHNKTLWQASKHVIDNMQTKMLRGEPLNLVFALSGHGVEFEWENAELKWVKTADRYPLRTDLSDEEFLKKYGLTKRMEFHPASKDVNQVWRREGRPHSEDFNPGFRKQMPNFFKNVY